MQIVFVMPSNMDEVVLHLGVVRRGLSNISRNNIAISLQEAHFSSNWSIILSFTVLHFVLPASTSHDCSHLQV